MEREYVGRHLRLRALEDDDLDAVAALYRATPNYLAAIGSGREAVSKLELQREFMEAQSMEGRTLFAIVRSSDPALIGIADVQLEATMSDTATIALLLISGPYQQQGYGSEAADLIEAAVCRIDGVEFVMAGVPEASPIGQRFWQGRGYEYSGSTTHDPQSSRTTLLMAKRCPDRAREETAAPANIR